MSRRIEITADGSKTVFDDQVGATFHSLHGAERESVHVFIKAGLEPAISVFGNALRIFEMGFGTGLNALLTLRHTGHGKIHYEAVEKHPLEAGIFRPLAGHYSWNASERSAFLAMHEGPWNEPLAISDTFTLLKHHGDLLDFRPEGFFHLVYFDAFAPANAPELWREDIFRLLYDHMAPGGILSTFCAKGEVRRCMLRAGFNVERIPGPPGKREMLRATRSG
jgi:tRNA U34 5-methylaminomethyl-2-thiouridine-forming methyltransferase MnmC